LLEYCIREDLNKKALRVMGVINPLKVTIENYPEGKVEELEAVNNPEDESQELERCRFRGFCISNATTSWKIHLRNSSGWHLVSR
jgi:hypothetical protein